MRKFLPLLLVPALLLAFAFPATAGAAQHTGGGLLSGIPVTGTLANNEPFEGTLNITQITRDGTQLLFDGQVFDAAGELVGTFEAVLGTLTGGPGGGGGQQASCQILFLDLGPIFLDVLGLQVDLSQITLDVTAVPGAGNLLGNLLCAVAGLLDGGLNIGGLLDGLLRQINRLL
jgi:hypothetical protein